MKFRAHIAVIVVALAAMPAHAAEFTGPGQAVDGGAIEIAGTVVRLHGIAAPARGQDCTRSDGRAYDCAQEAGWALADRIGRHWLRCITRGTDADGRTVATCIIGSDIDVSAHMVRQGWALARREEELAYVALEDSARQERLGLWAGTFTAPLRRAD